MAVAAHAAAAAAAAASVLIAEILKRMAHWMSVARRRETGDEMEQDDLKPKVNVLILYFVEKQCDFIPLREPLKEECERDLCLIPLLPPDFESRSDQIERIRGELKKRVLADPSWNCFIPVRQWFRVSFESIRLRFKGSFGTAKIRVRIMPYHCVRPIFHDFFDVVLSRYSSCCLPSVMRRPNHRKWRAARLRRHWEWRTQEQERRLKKEEEEEEEGIEKLARLRI